MTPSADRESPSTHADELGARLRADWLAAEVPDAGFTRAVMARVQALAQAQRARQLLSPSQARQWLQQQQALARHRARQTGRALALGGLMGALCWVGGSDGAWLPGGHAAWALGLGGLITSGVLVWAMAMGEG
jgi:hypothetical protein